MVILFNLPIHNYKKKKIFIKGEYFLPEYRDKLDDVIYDTY